MGGFQVSSDTGGTFTDAVVADASGAQSLGKALTTEGRISRGVRAAIEAAAAEMGLAPAELLAETDLLVYGTTAATNAIVTSPCWIRSRRFEGGPTPEGGYGDPRTRDPEAVLADG